MNKITQDASFRASCWFCFMVCLGIIASEGVKAMFSWTIQYLSEEGILLVKSKGEMDVPSANRMVKDIAEAAVEYQCFSHLIDHRETIFAFNLSDFYDRPFVNEKLGISRRFQTAMVFSQLTEGTRFMETVFRNRGYDLRHFTDIDEAKAWLKKQASV
ncbi:MAG TPA: hypothetical protein VK851_04145 [Anaerolineales bacterium]|nr:hypothetical protein [Anaerolineales bacterium]